MNEEEKASGPYQVGNCKPPLEHRFKPGQSGNPSGKKPGTRSVRALFLKAAFARPQRRYPEDRTATSSTQLEAMFARLLDEAAHGDSQATARVLALCASYLTDEPVDPAPDATEDASADPMAAS
jgi:hypothetical protein